MLREKGEREKGRKEKKKKKKEYSKIFQMEFVPILRWMDYGGLEKKLNLEKKKRIILCNPSLLLKSTYESSRAKRSTPMQ